MPRHVDRARLARTQLSGVAETGTERTSGLLSLTSSATPLGGGGISFRGSALPFHRQSYGTGAVTYSYPSSLGASAPAPPKGRGRVSGALCHASGAAASAQVFSAERDALKAPPACPLKPGPTGLGGARAAAATRAVARAAREALITTAVSLVANIASIWRVETVSRPSAALCKAPTCPPRHPPRLPRCWTLSAHSRRSGIRGRQQVLCCARVSECRAAWNREKVTPVNACYGISPRMLWGWTRKDRLVSVRLSE